MTARPIAFLRSVRGRLILAFVGISMLSLVAAGAGLFSLERVNGALNRIADDRVPQALALVEVSRQAEQILNAAPALLVVTSEVSRAEVSDTVRREVAKLKAILSVADTANDGQIQSEGSVATLVERLEANLLELDALVTERILLTETREGLARNLATVNNGALRLIAPAERQLGAQISSWNRSGAPEADSIDPEQGEIARGIIEILPQQDLATKIGAVGNALTSIATAETVEEVEVLKFGLDTALSELVAANEEMPAALKRRLVRLIGAFVELAQGEQSVPEVRSRELATITAAEQLMQAKPNL